MTKATLRVLLLSTSMLTAGLWAADTVTFPGSTSTAAPAPAPKQQKLLKVCSLNTAQSFQEFQANVQVVQTQRQLAIEANTAYEKETNATKKKELKAKVDELLAKLNENNQTMIKTYGFSLERSYTVAVEKADVYMLVTDEEAAKIEKNQAAAAKK
ncbi:MAG: hypothetical protein WC661_10595 [Opitutaceae bacterium]